MYKSNFNLKAFSRRKRCVFPVPTDVVQGEIVSRRKRHVTEGDAGLELENEELVREVRKERRRSRRSTVMLALTMAIKRCETLRSLCDIEYEEGDKKVRLRIADEWKISKFQLLKKKNAFYAQHADMQKSVFTKSSGKIFSLWNRFRMRVVNSDITRDQSCEGDDAHLTWAQHWVFNRQLSCGWALCRVLFLIYKKK